MGKTKREQVTVYVGGHMSALVQSPRPLDPEAWWPNLTVGGAVQRCAVIGPERDLFDVLRKFQGRRVRITVSEVASGA